MQVNEHNTGWIRKRFIISCTLMATDIESLEKELESAKFEIQHALEFHKHACKKIQIVVASGQKSSRTMRPAMRERLESDPKLKEFARLTTVEASFLTRMGDAEGRFRIHQG